jgi:hypothetical protein
MNWFGKKKKDEASTVSSGSASRQTAGDPNGTIVKLRENIKTQEKR